MVIKTVVRISIVLVGPLILESILGLILVFLVGSHFKSTVWSRKNKVNIIHDLRFRAGYFCKLIFVNYILLGVNAARNITKSTLPEVTIKKGTEYTIESKNTFMKKMKSCSVELPIGGGLDFLNFGDGSQIWRWQR